MKKQKKHLQLLCCPHCGSTNKNIVIALPLLGRVGARVECAACGYKTDTYNIHETILTETALSTQITKESIAVGVKKAISEWSCFYKGEKNGG